MIGESAVNEVRELAGQMTPKKQDALIRWLEGLTAEKLLDGGIELSGSLSGLYQFRSAMFTLRFIVRDSAPIVVQLLRNP